ncbi:hypothetical protein C0J52_14258 [Blattella germanica]|nr:hypothetical protein C0J52_14258 [Blattella germanica]
MRSRRNEFFDLDNPRHWDQVLSIIEEPVSQDDISDGCDSDADENYVIHTFNSYLILRSNNPESTEIRNRRQFLKRLMIDLTHEQMNERANCQYLPKSIRSAAKKIPGIKEEPQPREDSNKRGRFTTFSKRCVKENFAVPVLLRIQILPYPSSCPGNKIKTNGLPIIYAAIRDKDCRPLPPANVSSYKSSDDEGADSLSTPSSSSRVGSTRVSSSESESDSDNEICDEATKRGRHKKDFKPKQEQHLGHSGLNEKIQNWLECDVDDPGHQVLTDDEIIASVINDQDLCDEEEEPSDEDCAEKGPSSEEAFHCLETAMKILKHEIKTYFQIKKLPLHNQHDLKHFQNNGQSSLPIVHFFDKRLDKPATQTITTMYSTTKCPGLALVWRIWKIENKSRIPCLSRAVVLPLPECLRIASNPLQDLSATSPFPECLNNYGKRILSGHEVSAKNRGAYTYSRTLKRIFMSLVLFGGVVMIIYTIGIKVLFHSAYPAAQYILITCGLFLIFFNSYKPGCGLSIWLAIGFINAVFGIILTALLPNVARNINQQLKNSLYRGMGQYLDDPTWKRTFDKVQSEMECCGTLSYTDWHRASWIKLDFLRQESHTVKQADGRVLPPVVPWSCCNPKVLYPCFHDILQQKRSFKEWREEHKTTVDSLYTEGCLEVLKPILQSGLDATIGITIVIFILQLLLEVLSRYHYTASRNSILLGDPYNSSYGWLFGLGDFGNKRGHTMQQLEEHFISPPKATAQKLLEEGEKQKQNQGKASDVESQQTSTETSSLLNQEKGKGRKIRKSKRKNRTEKPTKIYLKEESS